MDKAAHIILLSIVLGILAGSGLAAPSTTPCALVAPPHCDSSPCRRSEHDWKTIPPILDALSAEMGHPLLDWNISLQQDFTHPAGGIPATDPRMVVFLAVGDLPLKPISPCEPLALPGFLCRAP